MFISLAIGLFSCVSTTLRSNTVSKLTHYLNSVNTFFVHFRGDLPQGLFHCDVDRGSFCDLIVVRIACRCHIYNEFVFALFQALLDGNRSV